MPATPTSPGVPSADQPLPVLPSPLPSPRPVSVPAPEPRQASFDELGRPLSQVTFVVVDLETTGVSPTEDAITEVGAVKVRGGEVIAEMATLVNPGRSIPPVVTVLTGLTDRMVAAAPRIEQVLPIFLEFTQGTVLVAHNAGFDLGFLRAAVERAGYPVPKWEHLDTVRLARQVVTRDESPDCRLSSLARLFGSATQPCHRALADARATVDVLHALFERVGNLGVTTVEDVHGLCMRVSPAQRRKRYLADGLPTGPGVYVFRDGSGKALYVGTSRSVRSRVRTYFTASEPRTRMAEMVAVAERVDAIGCAHPLEAEVRELRLIAELTPPYNRRSRFPERAVFLKLTDEPFPRLSRVRAVRDDGTYLGPFGSTRAAELAAAALHDAVPLRQCTARLSPRRPVPACILADLGKCPSPCDGRASRDDYAVVVEAARTAITTDPAVVIEAAERRIGELADAQRYEEAAVHRDRMVAFLRAAARGQRLTALSGIPQLVAAAPRDDRGWDLAVVRHGRLAGASSVPPGVDPRPWVDALVLTAETVRLASPGPTPCATAEEMERIDRWLGGPGVRLVRLDGEWSSLARGAVRALARCRAARAESRSVAGSADSSRRNRRQASTVHRPAEMASERQVSSAAGAPVRSNRSGGRGMSVRRIV